MNVRYDYSSELFLTARLNWLADTIRVVLINTTNYLVQPTIHRSLSDVSPAARIAISSPLTGKSAVKGVARASDLTITNVLGAAPSAMIIYHDSGSESTSELIAYIDTASNLPINPQSFNQPSGGNQGSTVVVHFDTGPNGIFKL